MTSVLAIHAVLELLRRLSHTVREFAAKDEAARMAHETRRVALTKSAEAAAQQRAVRLTEQIAQLEAGFKDSQAALQARLEARQTRIHQAHKRCRKRALEAIEQSESREKYIFQKRTLDAERLRESQITNAARAREQFHQQIADSQAAFHALESSAQQAFSPVPEFRQYLAVEREWPKKPAPAPTDENQTLQALHQLAVEIDQGIQRFRKNIALGLFRAVSFGVLTAGLIVACGGMIFAIAQGKIDWITIPQVGLGLGIALGTLVILYFVGKRLGRVKAANIAAGLSQAREWHSLCHTQVEESHLRETARIQSEWETTTRQLSERWEQAWHEAEGQRVRRPKEIDVQRDRALEKSLALHARKAANSDHEFKEAIQDLRAVAEREERDAAGASESNLTRWQGDISHETQSLHKEWHGAIQPIWDQIGQVNQAATQLCPEWTAEAWDSWTFPNTFPEAATFGRIEVDVEELAGVKFRTGGLQFPGPTRFSLPLFLEFPRNGSLLLETNATGKEEAIGAINSAVFRLLALAPPGKLSFTILDPAGLGQNFAGLMHLADFEGSPLHTRIWTQSAQIEEKLGELNEHMEKVIQMYLRNEYATITEYNAQAGPMAEKFHILVIAGFPSNFSETAGRRLMNIAASGARCGVFTLIQWDKRLEPPHGFLGNDLRKNSIVLSSGKDGFTLGEGNPLPGTRVRLDAPPSPAFATEFLRKVGEAASTVSRVELPFSEIAPPEAERWSESTAEEVRVPIGRSGASKPQYLALGKGTRQHVLIAGKTGSGKSTLFHVMITNLALRFSPEEVEFYLIDFKKGVEFKCYANHRLPHARVVAIESDREFGLSVLQRVDEELRRRGELFRRADSQDLPGYRKAAGKPLPRVLLLIDEFQEFFTEEDRISQSAAVLLDRIVRQGRAFGIHVILGSQTLGGAFSLARATMGQMVVRIALQSNEADAYLIMDESNAAPRLLSRPGEGIYNDMAGALEGNSPFQTAWLSDDARDEYLAEVRAQARTQPAWPKGPIVFEGNAPADVRENRALRQALEHLPTAPPAAARIWLGAPNSIKGPTEVILQPQSGSNLLVVGQTEEGAIGIPAMAMVSLSAQYPVGGVRLVLLENTPPESPERQFLDRVVQMLPHRVLRPKRLELGDSLKSLAQEVVSRTPDADAAPAVPTFLIVVNLHEFRPLRPDDDFGFRTTSEESANPAASFSTLLVEGASRGCHIIASIDTYNNVSRFLGRKGLTEFHARVLFQMSASDSASLIDNPDASRLGLHRAMLYNEREGHVEKFRPYALMQGSWFEWLEAAFAASSSPVGTTSGK